MRQKQRSSDFQSLFDCRPSGTRLACMPTLTVVLLEQVLWSRNTRPGTVAGEQSASSRFCLASSEMRCEHQTDVLRCVAGLTLDQTRYRGFRGDAHHLTSHSPPRPSHPSHVLGRSLLRFQPGRDVATSPGEGDPQAKRGRRRATKTSHLQIRPNQQTRNGLL